MSAPSLPGEELVRKGIDDLEAGIQSLEALLVSIGSPPPRAAWLHDHGADCLPGAQASTCLETEDERERFVDGAELGRRDPVYVLAEAPEVDCTELLDEHTGLLSADLDLGPERCRPGAARGWGDDRGREMEQFVGLDDQGVPRTGLLVAAPAREADAIDVATSHSGQSAAIASISAMTARRSFVSSGSAANRATSSRSAERRRRRAAASRSAVRTASESVMPLALRTTSSAAAEPSSRRTWSDRAMSRL